MTKHIRYKTYQNIKHIGYMCWLWMSPSTSAVLSADKIYSNRTAFHVFIFQFTICIMYQQIYIYSVLDFFSTLLRYSLHYNTNQTNKTYQLQNISATARTYQNCCCFFICFVSNMFCILMFFILYVNNILPYLD